MTLDPVIDLLEGVSDAVAQGVPAGDLFRVLSAAETARALLDQLSVTALKQLERDGEFSSRGYYSSAKALQDLTGCDYPEASRLVAVANWVRPDINLEGEVLEPRLPETGKVFDAGKCSLKHVEVIGKALQSPAAKRLSGDLRERAEAVLAGMALTYSVAELRTRAKDLITTLDQDGPDPTEESEGINRLRWQRNPDRPGGKLYGRYDSAEQFDAIVSAIEGGNQPVDRDDPRDLPTRNAESLSNACSFFLAHADSDLLPDTGGRKPTIHVTTRLEDLENRARTASLDYGGTLTPAALRNLCCDAGVIPIVLNGQGQPLDIGRLRRNWTDGQRRAIIVRDGGCVRCGKRAAHCEIHHIIPWECGGPTDIGNGVLVCKTCHRQIHHGGWQIGMRHRTPELIPPTWIDPQQRPRHRPRTVTIQQFTKFRVVPCADDPGRPRTARGPVHLC